MKGDQTIIIAVTNRGILTHIITIHESRKPKALYNNSPKQILMEVIVTDMYSTHKRHKGITQKAIVKTFLIIIP